MTPKPDYTPEQLRTLGAWAWMIAHDPATVLEALNGVVDTALIRKPDEADREMVAEAFASHLHSKAIGILTKGEGL